MKCWNCLSHQEAKDYNCTQCGQTLKPNTMQCVTARSRLDFLLREVEDWDFVEEEQLQGLKRIYQDRKVRLGQASAGSLPEWPDSDWSDPIWGELSKRVRQRVPPAKAPEVIGEDAKLKEIKTKEPVIKTELTVSQKTAAPESSEGKISEALSTPMNKASERVFVPAEPTVADKLLAETDIRWFHSLGALLVIAAVIGWLRVSWDDYGKALTGILIMVSPALSYMVSRQLKESAPLSAKLLSILGNILTAPALLAVDVFGFLPQAVPRDLYWTLALAVASALLNWQAHKTHEKVPLFIGALCAITAGWSLGALATAALSLALAFLFARVKIEDTDDKPLQSWKLQVERVGFAAGFFGSATTLLLFNPEQNPLAPMVMFGAALLYLHLPTLTKSSTSSDPSSNRVVLQACFTVIGSFLMRWLLGVPAAGVGLYILLAAGLFLSAKPKDEMGLLAIRLGSLLGLMGLLIGFISGLGDYLGAISINNTQVSLRFLLAISGAVFYAIMSRKERLKSQRTPLFLGALISIFGGWVHLFLFYCSEQDHDLKLQSLSGWEPLLYSLPLLAFLFVVGSRWLRSHERLVAETFSLGIAVCLTAINSLLTLVGVALRIDGQTTTTITAAAFCGLLTVLTVTWERGWLLPHLKVDGQAGQTLDTQVPQMLGLFLPRLALWSAILLSLNLELSEYYLLGLGALATLFVINLVGPFEYRRPAVEIAWLVSIPTYAAVSGQSPSWLVLFCPVILMAFAWAGRELREPGFWAATAMSSFVLISFEPEQQILALLILPIAYLASTISTPWDRKAEIRKPGSERFGFDILANLSLFVIGSTLQVGDETLAMAAILPWLCGMLLWASEKNWALHGVGKHTGFVLAGSSLLWSFAVGPKESGILLLLFAIATGITRQPKSGPLSYLDLVNGLTILGGAWLTAEYHYAPTGWILVTGIMLSEILALGIPNWRPNLSNPLLSIALFLVYGEGNLGSPELEPALLAVVLMGARGLREAQTGLFTMGLSLYLVFSNALLGHYKLGGFLMPAALAFATMGLWLWNKTDHPSLRKFRISPPTILRLSLALTVMPRILEFLVGRDLFYNFLFILVSGTLCIALSGACKPFAGLGELIKQSGGWILTAWAAVSMLRVAAILPWQGATLLLGLACLVAGVMKEKKRKG